MNNTIGVSTRPISIQPCEISGQQISSVNARELHEFLNVGRDFSNWIKSRIQQYQFVENEDYIIIAKTGDNSKRGPKFIEYHVTIDMAKELSMVERTERGRQARRYFIECEKIAKDKIKNEQDSAPETSSKILLEKAFNLIESYQAELTYLRNEREQSKQLIPRGSEGNPIFVEYDGSFGDDFRIIYKGYHFRLINKDNR